MIKLVEEHFPGDKLAEEQNRPCVDSYTKAQREEIRRRHKEGESHYQMAIDFGISQKAAYVAIVSNWKEPTDV